MFENAENLAKFSSLRAKYLCSVLPECFNSAADFSVKDCTPNLLKLCEHFAQCEQIKDFEKDVNFGVLAACDTLMTSVEWPAVWHYFLTNGSPSTLEEVAGNASRKFSIRLPSKPPQVNGNGNSNSSKDEGEKKTGDGAEAEAKEKAAEAGAPAQEAVQEAEQEAEAEEEDDEQLDDFSSLQLVNTYRLPTLDDALDASPEAKALGLSKISGAFLRRFEVELERVMWHIWTDFCEDEETSVSLDLSKTNKTEAIMVKYPTSLGLQLPFRGKVTCNPSGAKAPRHLLTKAFGLNFFVEPPSDNICIPAWSVKTTSRHDLAYFEQIVRKIEIAMLIPQPVPTACLVNKDSMEVDPDKVVFELIPCVPDPRPDEPNKTFQSPVWRLEDVP